MQTIQQSQFQQRTGGLHAELTSERAQDIADQGVRRKHLQNYVIADITTDIRLPNGDPAPIDENSSVIYKVIKSKVIALNPQIVHNENKQRKGCVDGCSGYVTGGKALYKIGKVMLNSRAHEQSATDL